MAKDIFVSLARCTYCGQPAAKAWDADLFSCRREVCEELAYGEMKRRERVRARSAA